MTNYDPALECFVTTDKDTGREWFGRTLAESQRNAADAQRVEAEHALKSAEATRRVLFGVAG